MLTRFGRSGIITSYGYYPKERAKEESDKEFGDAAEKYKAVCY